MSCGRCSVRSRYVTVPVRYATGANTVRFVTVAVRYATCANTVRFGTVTKSMFFYCNSAWVGQLVNLVFFLIQKALDEYYKNTNNDPNVKIRVCVDVDKCNEDER